MLGMIKMPFKDLRKEILAVNDQIVTDNMLNQFLNYVPTSEEISALEPYKETPDVLQISDRFFLMVPFLPFFLSFFPSFFHTPHLLLLFCSPVGLFYSPVQHEAEDHDVQEELPKQNR